MSELECPVAAAARRWPARQALEFEGRRWTWSELDGAVGGFTQWLGDRGVGPRARVGTLTWNRPELVFTWFAAARLGAALVPLNARLTARELAPLIERAKATLWLADEALSERLPHSLAFPSPPPACGTARLSLDAELAALFTSGTTGAPSLVPLTVANFFASHRANAANLGASEAQRWLGTLPLFHVGGLAMAFRWAMMGGELILERQFEARRVNEHFDRARVTHASLVPTALARVIDGRATPYPPALEAILIGGGPMGVPLLARARALRLPVLQTYGLTEACSQVTTERLADADGTTAGAPLEGLALEIVDERGAPLAVGTTGLIRVKGPTITPAAGEWLSTNDLGALDARGRLTVFARRADLILSGGENVYPAEVEAVLAESPLVEDVAVLPRPDAEWGQVPVALVVWKGPVDVAALEAFARSRLASFKVPRQFVVCTRVPRNAAGKLLRHELGALFPADSQTC